MKVLVVGKGGREHALAKALVDSPSVSQVFSAPGSHGMASQGVEPTSYQNSNDLVQTVEDQEIDLVVIGPEAPLVEGLSDQLREKGIVVFGPDQKGAQLEGSKVFSKEFMMRHKLPTASYSVVTNVETTMVEAEKFKPPYVLKADGLAAGKGVFICRTLGELQDAAQQLFVEKSLGEAGAKALLEEFKEGYELSFFVLTNSEDYVSLPLAQDHKRLQDKDQGPNTGGMGTVAPMKIDDEDYRAIIKQVVEPTVAGLKADGFDYRGVVFIGIMMTADGPQVLEYNVRFGDPETQVLLPLLDGDWGKAFMAIAKGEMPQLSWKSSYASCVVLAAENYPASPVKGVAIEGDWSQTEQQYFLHAGTDFKSEQWLVNGGRVLNAIGLGETMEESISKAYEQADKVQWPGMQKRTDIGQRALSLKS